MSDQNQPKKILCSRRDFLFYSAAGLGVAGLGAAGAAGLGAAGLGSETIRKFLSSNWTTTERFFGGSSNSKLYTQSQKHLGTWVVLRVFSGDEDKARRGLSKAFQAFHQVDLEMSIHRPQSLLSQINFHAGKKSKRQDQKASPSLIEVLQKGLEISQRSQGVYDLSILPLMRLYGFYIQNPEKWIPSDRQIHQAIEAMSYRHIQIDPLRNVIALEKPGMGLDLGSIGKGYALDKAAEALKREGIRSALLDAGGNLLAFGAPFEDEDPKMGWTVGIPSSSNSKSMKTVILRDQAIATSNNDHQLKTVLAHSSSGAISKEIGHIFNALTGQPVLKSSSCSVIASSGMESDALSTCGYLLGPQLASKVFPEGQFFFSEV